MYIERYLNNETEFEEYLNSVDEFGQEQYALPYPIKCRIEGEKRFYMNKDGVLEVSDMSYITLHHVKVRDRINGQYVKSVKIIYDFNGRELYREAYM